MYLMMMIIAMSALSGLMIVTAAVEASRVQSSIEVPSGFDLLPVISIVIVGSVARLRRKLRASLIH